MDLEGLEAEGDRREKNMKGLFSGMLHDREANNTRRSQNNIERSKTKAHGAFTYHHITSHHHIITATEFFAFCTFNPPSGNMETGTDGRNAREICI